MKHQTFRSAIVSLGLALVIEDVLPKIDGDAVAVELMPADFRLKP